jgi:hypothetical protein
MLLVLQLYFGLDGAARRAKTATLRPASDSMPKNSIGDFMTSLLAVSCTYVYRREAVPPSPRSPPPPTLSRPLLLSYMAQHIVGHPQVSEPGCLNASIQTNRRYTKNTVLTSTDTGAEIVNVAKYNGRNQLIYSFHLILTLNCIHLLSQFHDLSSSRTKLCSSSCKLCFSRWISFSVHKHHYTYTNV